MSKIQVYLKLKPNNGVSNYKNHNENGSYNSSILNSEYRFNKTFNESINTQKYYELSIKQSLDNFLTNEKDLTIFNFGPSLTGKTYSMIGNVNELNNKQNVTLLKLSLNNIFDQVNKLNGGANFPDSNLYHEILGSYYGGLLLNGNDIITEILPTSSIASNRNSLQQSSASLFNNLQEEILPLNDSKKLDDKYLVSLNIYEIFDDQIVDLFELTKDYTFLKKQINKQLNKSIEIITDLKDNKIKPSNIFTISTNSFNQCLLIIQSALKNRKTNQFNNSSKSHLFISINCHKISINEGKTNIKKSFFSSNNHNKDQENVITHHSFPNKNITIKTTKFLMVDLASFKKTGPTNNMNNPNSVNTFNVNQSLIDLFNILPTLNRNKKKFIRDNKKYLLRNNKLSRLLLNDYINDMENQMIILVHWNRRTNDSNTNQEDGSLKLLVPLITAANSFSKSQNSSPDISYENKRFSKFKSPKLMNKSSSISKQNNDSTVSLPQSRLSNRHPTPKRSNWSISSRNTMAAMNPPSAPPKISSNPLRSLKSVFKKASNNDSLTNVNELNLRKVPSENSVSMKSYSGSISIRKLSVIRKWKMKEEGDKLKNRKDLEMFKNNHNGQSSSPLTESFSINDIKSGSSNETKKTKNYLPDEKRPIPVVDTTYLTIKHNLSNNNSATTITTVIPADERDEKIKSIYDDNNNKISLFDKLESDFKYERTRYEKIIQERDHEIFSLKKDLEFAKKQIEKMKDSVTIINYENNELKATIEELNQHNQLLENSAKLDFSTDETQLSSVTHENHNYDERPTTGGTAYSDADTEITRINDSHEFQVIHKIEENKSVDQTVNILTEISNNKSNPINFLNSPYHEYRPEYSSLVHQVINEETDEEYESDVKQESDQSRLKKERINSFYFEEEDEDEDQEGDDSVSIFEKIMEHNEKIQNLAIS